MFRYSNDLFSNHSKAQCLVSVWDPGALGTCWKKNLENPILETILLLALPNLESGDPKLAQWRPLLNENFG